jgi:hypothetical protein
MRRATFVLAPGLAAAVLAGAFVDGFRSQRAATPAPAEPGQAVADQPQALPSVALERDPSTSTENEQSSNPHPDGRAPKRQPPDEAIARAHMEESAAQEVRDSYSLLLEDFALPPREQEDLVALLIEMRIEGMWTSTKAGQIRGREIPEQERHDRITAVIGDQKLREFLALEENGQAYWETQQIASLLRRRGVPLTKPQRDKVFEILVEVRARYPHSQPPPELDPRSVEYIEHTITQLDEFDRHVVELAPSVLSPTQVVHLFNAYEAMSRDRISAIEMQKKRKAADDPVFRDVGWSYPARWNPR